MKKQSIGGYLYLAFIGLALALMGGFFVFVLGRGYLRAKETREWPGHPAVVVVSEVSDRQIGKAKEYCHKLVYEYRIDGEFYRGARLKRRENPYLKEESKILPSVNSFPVGSKVEAFVNPDDPAEALLEHETRAPGYSIWFPALFLIGGLMVFFRALLKLRERRGA
ncbi:MAG: DUF3592 domain-containing protein [Akkermansiaceae bacterium]